MHSHTRYMHVKYQPNRDNWFVKTVNTKKDICINLLLAIRISKPLLSDMYYPTPDIWAEFEIYRPVNYSATKHQSYFHERQTDGRTNRRRRRQQ